MKKNILFVLFVTGIILLTALSWRQPIPSQHLFYQSAELLDTQPSRELVRDPSQSQIPISHQIGIPSALFSLEQESLVNEYQETLAKVNIPVSDEQCEQKPGLVLYGYYDRIDNLMVICKDAMEQSDEYVETLIHESWHAVQDCIDGLDNSEITAFLTKDPELLTTMLKGLTPSEVDNILQNYEKVDQAYEVEAFFLQKYPNLVLKGLNTCISTISSS